MSFATSRNDSDTRMDAEVGIFLRRELEHILSRTFETQYADIKYATLLPVSSEVGNAATTYTYRIFDAVGRMERIADRVQDLPRADILRTEKTMRIQSYGASFGYGVQETRAAMMVPGLNLEQRRADAVRRVYEETVNKIALFGDSAGSLEGFLNNSNVDVLAVTGNYFNDGSITPDEMLAILNEACTRIVGNSNQKESPDTMVVPYPVYRQISTTPRSSTSDTTVLEFFLRTNPYITSIEPLNEVEATKSFGNLSKDRIVVYKRSPDKLQLHIPQTIEFFPPERRGLEYVVAAHARLGGVSYYYPASALYVQKAS